jgi:hypothetical protein
MLLLLETSSLLLVDLVVSWQFGNDGDGGAEGDDVVMLRSQKYVNIKTLKTGKMSYQTYLMEPGATHSPKIAFFRQRSTNENNPNCNTNFSQGDKVRKCKVLVWPVLCCSWCCCHIAPIISLGPASLAPQAKTVSMFEPRGPLFESRKNQAAHKTRARKKFRRYSYTRIFLLGLPLSALGQFHHGGHGRRSVVTGSIVNGSHAGSLIQRLMGTDQAAATLLDSVIWLWHFHDSTQSNGR